VRGDGADLDVTEPELTESANRQSVFVEACRDAEGRWEAKPESLDFERTIGRRERLHEATDAERRKHPDEPECEVVGVFGVHAREDEGEEKSIHAGHKAIGAAALGAPPCVRSCSLRGTRG
jgi:hypothetical protein